MLCLIIYQHIHKLFVSLIVYTVCILYRQYVFIYSYFVTCYCSIWFHGHQTK